MKRSLQVCIGIQARSTSSRLPNKIAEYIGNKMVIEHVIDAATNAARYLNRYSLQNGINCSVFVLIPEGDPIKRLLTISPSSIVEGDERDVLSRYVKMGEMHAADFIVRITADCPLIPPFLIYKCINSAVKNDFDYFSNVGDVGGDSVRTSIDGHDVEVISAKAMAWANQTAKSSEQREHVSLVLRDQWVPSALKRGVLIGHNDHSDIKLSIDTEEDLTRVRSEFDRLKKKISQAEKTYGKSSVHRF